MKTIANVKIGKADVSPALPSHVKGVSEGNAPGSIKAAPGLHRVEGTVKASARRSTGITPEDSEPIDSSMPVLTPA